MFKTDSIVTPSSSTFLLSNSDKTGGRESCMSRKDGVKSTTFNPLNFPATMFNKIKTPYGNKTFLFLLRGSIEGRNNIFAGNSSINLVWPQDNRQQLRGKVSEKIWRMYSYIYISAAE